ncbi:hypothetical protein B0J14DRAFT_20477 [Halenospora varia]|nr:hypothetical protein B0J14DRAFT_20477 [Halenospora varia]
MGNFDTEASFPRFGDLPPEIRHMIWTSALPGPRIVELQQRNLKITVGEWYRNHGPGRYFDEKDATERLARYLFQEEDGLRELQVLLGLPDWDPILGDPEILEGRIRKDHPERTVTEHLSLLPMQGFKSRDPFPQSILSSCREAHQIASRIFRPYFKTVGAAPETYLDCQHDIVYIRYPRFSSFMGSSYNISDTLLSLSDTDTLHDVARIQNLAIQLTTMSDGEHARSYFQGEEFEYYLANLLSDFGGVRRLILVLTHICAESLDLKEEPFQFIAPYDVEATCEAYEEYITNFGSGNEGIPDMKYMRLEPFNADLKTLAEKLRECSDADRETYPIPQVEYKIAINAVTKERMDDLRKRCQEIDAKIGKQDSSTATNCI